MFQFYRQNIATKWNARKPPVTFERNIVVRNGKGRETRRILRGNTVVQSNTIPLNVSNGIDTGTDTGRRTRKGRRRNPKKYRKTPHH